MTGEEIEAFLAEPHLAHIATVDERGKPRARPVWFLWRDGTLWFTTRVRVRAFGRDIARGSPVAVSIGSEDRPYRAVVATGRPEVVGRDRDLLLAIATRYGENAGRRWVEEEALRQDDRIVFRVEPDELISWDYGKS
jgi:PPOX class probable F420-dependent enzyme